MPNKPKPMTPDEIQDAMQAFVSDAQTYLEAELSPDRVKATKYYRGDLFGNEEKGRSQYVSTDVRDAILAVMPSLVRLFLPTSGHVLEYQARPKSPDEIDRAVALAEQATEFVNEIVLDQDNDGFLELHAAFKDALVRKLGTIKFWWEDRSVYQAYTAQRLDVLQYEQLVKDEDVEVTHVEETKATGQPTFYTVDYKHWRKEGVATFRCVPPEEVLIARDARSRRDASFLAHQTEKTDSELLAMGVPQADLDEWGGASSEVRQSLEEVARRGGVSHVTKEPQPQLRKNLWIEAYPYLDVDGDGEAELVKLRCLGTSFHVIGEPEAISERPFAFFCPDPEPHVLVGQSFADRLMDLQLMKSSVVRAVADGLSQSLFPDTYYMEGVVSPQAMESTAMGKNIAVRDGLQPQQAIMEMKHEWAGQDGLAFVGYLDSVKTQRTGPLPATLDPDSLQSTPEIGVKATVQAASDQLELIARVFAATGMKQLGKGLLKLLVENQPRARLVRLRGQYVPVDPKAWDAEMDVAVHVALGTQEKLGVLAATAQKQEQILQILGPANPLVSLDQLRHTYAQLLALQGVPDVAKYWKDLPPNWQPPPVPPQPDPNMVLAQAETVKAQAQLAKNQADFQLEQVKRAQESQSMMTDGQLKAAELALKREEMHLVDARERDKAEADIAVKVAAMNAQFGSQVSIAEINAMIAREQMTSDEAIAVHQMASRTAAAKKPTPVAEPA